MLSYFNGSDTCSSIIQYKTSVNNLLEEVVLLCFSCKDKVADFALVLHQERGEAVVELGEGGGCKHI